MSVVIGKPGPMQFFSRSKAKNFAKATSQVRKRNKHCLKRSFLPVQKCSKPFPVNCLRLPDESIFSHKPG